MFNAFASFLIYFIYSCISFDHVSPVLGCIFLLNIISHFDFMLNITDKILLRILDFFHPLRNVRLVLLGNQFTCRSVSSSEVFLKLFWRRSGVVFVQFLVCPQLPTYGLIRQFTLLNMLKDHQGHTTLAG